MTPSRLQLALLTAVAIVVSSCGINQVSVAQVGDRAAGHRITNIHLFRESILDREIMIVNIAWGSDVRDADAVWCQVLIPLGLTDDNAEVDTPNGGPWEFPEQCPES